MALTLRTGASALPRPVPTAADSPVVEPLLPPGAAVLYLISPPFIALLLDSSPLEGELSTFWPLLLATWIHSIAIGGLIHALYTWVVPRLLLGPSWPGSKLIVHVAAVAVGVIGGMLLSFPVSKHFCGKIAGHDLVSELYTASLITAAFVATATSFEGMRRRAREIELRAQRSQEAAVRAELASLQARTNPHFLFNSLNTVVGLIRHDPQLAEATVERLADVFRYSLDASRRDSVPLFRELEIVRDYLEIESIRFGERLRWSVEAESQLERVLLPPLLLQPLVENAVRHGAGQRSAGATVSLRLQREGEFLEAIVDDDGPGPGHSSHRGSGTSITDLRERLELAYGASASFHLSSRPGGGCRAILRLPCEVAG